MPVNTMERVMRFFKIITLVSARPAALPLGRERLAQECRCSPRQLQRDLNFLQEEVGLQYDPQERSYVLPDKRGRFPIAPLTLEEAAALTVARGLLTAPGLPQGKRITAALDKATSTLSPALRDLLLHYAAVLQTPTLPRSYAAAPLMSLMDAARDQHVVRMDYDSLSGGKRMWRSMNPYAVEPRAGVYWELHGWCHENRAFRTFALDRLFGAEILPDTFTRDEEAWKTFLATQPVGGLRGDGATASDTAVEVRFAPEVAAYARRQPWASSLHLTDAPDGAVWLRGEIASLSGMVVELLRWRRYVFVRGGPDLKRAYEAELTMMVQAQNNPQNFSPP